MPFPYPSVPSRVKQLVSGKIVTTKMVRANAMCPPWLHDLYMTKSRDVVVAKKMKELKYWRTWHAPIDPVYWCYFGHEHGSFPGFYQPMFDYTAWKTKDADTDHGRQEESHEGFKVFSFPIESEGKFVVVIVHMHVSSERRFETGRHTVSFAVLDDGWDMLMELHMKMDFGGAQATIVKKEKGSKKKKKITIAVNEHEEKKINILRLRGRKAGRRFNVLNITEKYPASVNQTFLLNCGITPTAKNEHQVLKGIYEQWKGPLNTCMGTSPAENLLRGFTFDIRNPSTAMRSIDKPTTKQNMQMLSGSSMDRFLEISKRQGTLEVGIEHCHFDAFTSDAAIMLQKNLGVFYTDSFFTSVRDGPGKFSIRQFISPSFRSMRIPAGRITPSEMWWGHMAYQEGKKVVGRVAVNHENAVKANIN